MKEKTHDITGVFKNIPGKGTDETALAKKTWYSKKHTNQRLHMHSRN